MEQNLSSFFHRIKSFFLIAFFFSTSVFSIATENVLHLEDSPSLKDSPISSFSSKPSSNMPSLFLKTDLGFRAFDPTDQGFSLKHLRFGVKGDLNEQVSYHFSIGTVREFSSVLLPQLITEEAFIVFGEEFIKGKFGIFSPFLNSFWSTELLDSPLPSYSKVHEELLIKRDIGVELSSLINNINFTLGAFNGSGIISLNSTNSKLFTVSFSPNFQIGDHYLKSGFSVYYLSQSQGQDNYIEKIIGNLFLDWKYNIITSYVDLMYGKLSDNSRLSDAFGSTFFFMIRIFDFIDPFINIGFLDSKNTKSLKIYQVGSKLDFINKVNFFIYYELMAYPSSNGGSVNLTLRMSI